MSGKLSIKSLLLTSLAAMLMLSSCHDEGVDGPVSMSCTDIVTFAGNIAGAATFKFRQMDDSPEITLTSQGELDTEEIAPGTRLLISYIPYNNTAYSSGPITLSGGKVINQSTVATEWIDDFNLWNKDKVYLYSAWRSGEYLNIHVRLTYSPEPRLFCLAADPNTINGEWPDVYLVHALSKNVDFHDRAYYASFDLSPIWSSPTTKGIILHVANSNLDKQIFTFSKGI